MSTVLWANHLLDGRVVSDETDKYALYKCLDKLDELAVAAGQPPLSSLCDSTDEMINAGIADLPDGMASTYELMARDGVWVDAGAAVALLEALIGVLQGGAVRLGVFKNPVAEVIAELEQSLAFARQALANGARFNFSVVS